MQNPFKLSIRKLGNNYVARKFCLPHLAWLYLDMGNQVYDNKNTYFLLNPTPRDINMFCTTNNLAHAKNRVNLSK